MIKIIQIYKTSNDHVTDMVSSKYIGEEITMTQLLIMVRGQFGLKRVTAGDIEVVVSQYPHTCHGRFHR